MSFLRPLAVVATGAFLSACAMGQEAPRDGDTATGTAFTRALASEYSELARFESREMWDWADAEHFSDKGERAAQGEAVRPDTVGSRGVPWTRREEFSEARGDLVRLLNANARSRMPQQAARAQGRFDCWLEQEEEGNQPADIAACRNEFFSLLAELEAGMAPAPQPEPEPRPEPAPEPEPEAMAPESVTAYFGFDDASLTGDAMEKLREAAEEARGREDLSISITGHADRAGPEEYNLQLSLRRAENARGALLDMGLPEDSISIAGRGESEPAVPTEDGVREQDNRRVEVLVQ